MHRGRHAAEMGEDYGGGAIARRGVTLSGTEGAKRRAKIDLARRHRANGLDELGEGIIFQRIAGGPGRDHGLDPLLVVTRGCRPQHLLPHGSRTSSHGTRAKCLRS